MASMNYTVRKREVESINAENEVIFKKLHEVKPTYQTEKILKA